MGIVWGLDAGAVEGLTPDRVYPLRARAYARVHARRRLWISSRSWSECL